MPFRKMRPYIQDTGKYRHEIEVLDTTDATDELGGQVSKLNGNPTVVYTDMADVQDLSAFESTRLSTTDHRVTHTVYMRQVDLYPMKSYYHLRFKHFPTRVLAIVGVRDCANRQRVWEMTCEEIRNKL